MKELSNEDKAKRYDEALEKARLVLQERSNEPDGASVLSDLFPELTESEDERIRKSLIGHLKECRNNTRSEVMLGEYAKWIAWLEKQGEQKPIDKIQIGKKYKCIASPRYSTFFRGEIYKPEDEFLCSLMNFCSDCFEPIEDGEQKPTEEYNITGIGSKNAQGKLGEMIKNLKSVNEILEQKSADKVEPKFHEGDWVVRGKTIAQILDIQEQYYVGLDIDGNDFTSSRFLSDDKIHLWTIQDAKEGDVLVNDFHLIFILKEIKNNTFVSHCSVIEREDDVITNSIAEREVGYSELVKVYPATQEQRSKLFSKMAEEGYEWDAEKLELKKIEQKPAWSEEELDSITAAINNLEYLKNNYVYHPMGLEPAITFLKSLKERIVPQTKQEWSEEDESFYNRTIGLIKRYINSDSEVNKQNALSCINWLNSLRNRNCNNHEKREDANVIKYKVGDKVKFYSDSSEVFTISKIENNRYIFADSGGDTSVYEELIPVKESKDTLTKDKVKCGDYVVNKDGTVIKVHDIDNFGHVCFYYFANEMTEDGGQIQGNRAFMEHYGVIEDCRRATQNEIDFLEKWVAHKKYVWVEDNVSPYDEEED